MSKKELDPNKPEAISVSDLSQKNPAFDSLRGIFAIMVIFSHVELMKYYAGLEHYVNNNILFQSGRIGVTGFFVLSGFLITINLLRMKDAEGSFGNKLKTFYTRRILRIWPLYYTIILLSLYVFPHIDALRFTVPHEGIDARIDLNKFQYYYLFLLPHVPLAKYTILPFAEPSWSIGVEEIFYLVIPIVVFNVKRLPTVLIPTAIIIIIVRYITYTPADIPYCDILSSMLILSRYDCIIIGCLAGIYFYRRENFLLRINKYIFGSAILILILVFITTSVIVHQYYHFALLFAVIILYVAQNRNNFLNNKVLQFYGKISFSMYMIHEIVIVFLLNQHDYSDYHPAVLYIASFICITIAAFATYKIIEEPFLKLKSKVNTGKLIVEPDNINSTSTKRASL